MPKIVHHLFNSDEKHLEQIKESLLLGASDLAKNTSVENIKIDDLINKAEVSRSTFYKVFKSVDSLFKRLGQKMSNELTEYVLSQNLEIRDAATRVANKTKRALLTASKMPFLASLLLKAEWPSTDPNHAMYKDVEKDFIDGLAQGSFSDMPPSIGANLILGCLRGAVKDIIETKYPKDYADKAVCHLLISLGVDPKIADELSKTSTSPLPMPPKGIISNVVSLQDPTRTN